jgi:hypothetical protein
LAATNGVAPVAFGKPAPVATKTLKLHLAVSEIAENMHEGLLALRWPWVLACR